MVVIDSQVHCYERDSPTRPWASMLHGPPEVTGDDMVAAMNDVGVDGAILVSPWTLYGFDASYAIEVHADHPTRFGLVKPIDTTAPDVRHVVADWASTSGAVGVRIMMVGDVWAQPDQPGIDAVLSTAGRVGLPVNLLCWGRIGVAAELARRHADTQLVVDHLGIIQPFTPPVPQDPWADLPAVTELAKFPNVVIKLTGACTLSQTPFPYPDLWDPLARLFDDFGIERCMWGTDWTRAVELLTYRQGVEAFALTDRLSENERQLLMGNTAARVYRWEPGG
ncbi:amidohydrolase [Gemmatimonas sp.]|uniref:amidohydrolase family protein n=1 Tax=Gemmatimonas sp. TaxID=1962908 RepID=UPI00356347C1